MRGNNIIFGTTTTGTGTLALAATPVPPGGIDVDVLARALGYGNNASFVQRYSLIEFSDATFSQMVQMEIGRGTFTLGASAGIANVTMSRDILEMTATSLNAQPATLNFNPATGISIVTASHALIIFAPQATEFNILDSLQHANAAGLI